VKKRPPDKVEAAESVLLRHLLRRLTEDGFSETAKDIQQALQRLTWEKWHLLGKAAGK